MTTPTHSSDTELLYLCHEVYERTGWIIGTSSGFMPDDSVVARGMKQPIDELPQGSVCPVYTSDYLLEKLPASVQDYYLTLGKGDEYCAEYADSGTSSLYRRNADTPLKSLLKLTIALHEQGEIK